MKELREIYYFCAKKSHITVIDDNGLKLQPNMFYSYADFIGSKLLFNPNYSLLALKRKIVNDIKYYYDSDDKKVSELKVILDFMGS